MSKTSNHHPNCRCQACDISYRQPSRRDAATATPAPSAQTEALSPAEIIRQAMSLLGKRTSKAKTAAARENAKKPRGKKKRKK